MATDEPLLVVHEVEITEAEMRRYRYVSWADFVGIPIFIAWYFALGSFTAQDVDMPNEPSPAGLLVGLGVMAFIGFMAFFYHTQTWPTKADDDIFGAMEYLGRWLFLTRHCLALQGVHLVVSVYGAATSNAYLQRLTYGATYWVGGLGFFVTIQFFSLVHNNSEYVLKCKEMAGKRAFFGLVDFRGYLAWLHIPALPLAVCDVVFGKNHASLQAGAASLQTSCYFMFFYAAFYTGLILCNFAITGYFPYAVLKSLKTVVAWILFLGVQCILLVVFGFCMWALSFLPQPWL